MDVVLNCLTGGFSRSLEQRAHIYVESAVGIACSYNFCAAVMSVLTHFCDHYTWLTAFAFCEFLAHLLRFCEVRILFCLA